VFLVLIGIGLAIAKRLLGDGVKVMISSRKEKNVARALETLRGGEGGTEVKSLIKLIPLTSINPTNWNN
jgi:NAD(P)-dependent dehydrogenase (short-subunit alcohol dehydrogenase family)